MTRLTLKLAAVVAAAAITITAPAVAQTAAFSVSAITTGCNGGGCAGAVDAAIAAIEASDLSESEKNAQLGLLAAVLVNVAKTNPKVRQDVAQAMTDVAEASSDPEQQATIASVAVEVENPATDIASIDTSSPIGASPN